VTPTSTTPSSDLLPVPLTAAQKRIIDAARMLFAEHGISGTSLQMIADAIGVTKAAVYHQYKAKEDIVIAAADSELVVVERAIEEAETEPDDLAAREQLLRNLVTIVVERRRRAAVFQHDPVMIRLLAQHEPYRKVMERLYGILTGEEGPGARVQAAMLTSSMAAAVSHPLMTDLSDDELTRQLFHFARRLLIS
jgi:AcrR family transcriptional regulator